MVWRCRVILSSLFSRPRREGLPLLLFALCFVRARLFCSACARSSALRSYAKGFVVVEWAGQVGACVWKRSSAFALRRRCDGNCRRFRERSKWYSGGTVQKGARCEFSSSFYPSSSPHLCCSPARCAPLEDAPDSPSARSPPRNPFSRSDLDAVPPKLVRKFAGTRHVERSRTRSSRSRSNLSQRKVDVRPHVGVHWTKGVDEEHGNERRKVEVEGAL